MAKGNSTRRYVFLGPNGIGGGLSTENPIIVSDNQMVIADNILVGTSVARRKRGGQAKYHTGSFDLTASYPASSGASGVPIRGIIEYWRTASMAGNPVSDIFLHQGTRVWSIDDRNTPGVNRTGALSLGITGVPSYQVFDGILYFCSTTPSDGYNRWNGATATAVSATAPLDGPGKYLCAHLGRMIMAGNTDFPYRVYFSSALDPENWSTIVPNNATSFDLVDNGDPEGITGLASFQNRLYVFLRRSIYEIIGTDPATATVNLISSGIGCLGHASIIQTPNDILFASDRGVHSLKQIASGRQSESTFLSRDIQRLWTELLNTALYSRIMGMYDDTINCYVITVPSSGQTKNDQILTYNIEFGTWTVWPSIEARSLCPVLISNKKNILLGKENGVISLINQVARNDFGVGYTARFKTGVIYPGEAGVQKVFKSITLFASTTTIGNFSASYIVDGVKNGSRPFDLNAAQDVLGSTFVLGSSRLGVGQYIPMGMSIDEIGFGIQIEINCGGVSDLEFYGFILEVEDANPTIN